MSPAKDRVRSTLLQKIKPFIIQYLKCGFSVLVNSKKETAWAVSFSISYSMKNYCGLVIALASRMTAVCASARPFIEAPV